MNRFDRNTKNWIRSAAVRIVPLDRQVVFAVPESYFSDGLCCMLENFDSVLASGKILKNSPTTTASLAELDGKPVFLKRTNNKNWLFTLRYLFRSARAFRSAVAAEKLAQLGIPTPPVIAVGERRCGLVLKSGYLITGSEPGICGMDRAIFDSEKPVEKMSRFLDEAAEMIALLHRNNVVHGDLKLINFYQNSRGEPGIWDLDSVKVYRNGVPCSEVEKELTRLLASCVAVMQLIPGADVPEINALTEQFCTNYGRKSAFTPSWQKVAELVRKKLELWRNKK